MVTGSAEFCAGVTVSVSDSAGNLLFYSDGENVYNRNNVLMSNGTGLYGEVSSFNQSITTVKKINDDSSYYLFVCSHYPPSQLKPATCSMVDMRLDGGLGNIPLTQKNIPLKGGNKAFKAITATRHANNLDAWVVFRLADTDSNQQPFSGPGSMN